MRILTTEKFTKTCFTKIKKTKHNDFYSYTTSQFDYHLNSLNQSNPIPNRAYS